jgi:hypothetical protein
VQYFYSVSPSPQVTTRTTSLTSVPHAAFALRFSELTEIELACKESEEQRAVRTIDWIGARINNRSAKWVEDMEKAEGKDVLRTPWWDELRRCAEGDHVPSKTEGWNHPVASTSHSSSPCLSLNKYTVVIMAVSTMAPNPLQAITALHSRALDFPSWVDLTILRYTLIIHPRGSTLSDEEYVIPTAVYSSILTTAIYTERELFSMLSRSNMDCTATFFHSPFHHLHHLRFLFLHCCHVYPRCHLRTPLN